MKAERRHELKENDLGHMLLVAKDYVNQHGTRLGIMALVIVAVVAAVSLTGRSRAVSLEDAWQRRNSLVFDSVEEGRLSLETLEAMTKEATDPGFVLTSLIDQGRHALGLAQQVDNPPDAELNSAAREAFERLLALHGDNPVAFGAAHCGLATVEENAFSLDGDASHEDRAREHLHAVIDNPAIHSLPFHRLAVDRTVSLEKVFSVIQFAAAPPQEEPTKEEPAPIMVTPISEADVPHRLLQKVRVKEDGTLEVLEQREEPVP